MSTSGTVPPGVGYPDAAGARVGDHPGIGAGTRFAILTDGQLLEVAGKMAHGILRFRPDAAAVIIDARYAGQTADRLVPGVSARVPVVGTIDEALAHQPTALLLGTTPAGGQIADSWRPTILAAIGAGLHIVSGMHAFLGEDAALVAAASRHGVSLVDLRRPPDRLQLSTGRVLDLTDRRIVLTVGSDAAIGKMSTSLSLQRALAGRGVDAEFVATGQTGIAIAGWGVAIDRVVGDFMAGVTEELVLRAAERSRTVIVEGQGSIAHPAFSAVTLGLIHGAGPTDLILCHDQRRTEVIGYERMGVPSLARLVRTYEDLSTYLRPAKVRAIALNTSGLAEGAAQDAMRRIEDETGLPATDAIRDTGARLADLIEDAA
jgi:uncharacterized NAD-dependent epimerase/dehydratase family protein